MIPHAVNSDKDINRLKYKCFHRCFSFDYKIPQSVNYFADVYRKYY